MLKHTPDSLMARALALYRAHKAIIFMLLAQLCSSLLGASAKLLQTTGGLAAEQVLFAGMGSMMVLSWAYMGIRRVPNGPLGPRNVWGLLVLRGVAGFVGIWGYYYSLRFLPISEATVINFLSPMVAAFAIATLLRAPFTRFQRLAGLASFFGVILIAKPWHIVWPHALNCIDTSAASALANSTTLPTAAATAAATSTAAMPTPTLCSHEDLHRPSPLEHAVAIGVALIGALGGAGGFVTLSWIGTDAHPMISVAYFATATTLLSGISFLVQPEETFVWPADTYVWTLLGVQGIVSFVMNILQAASLAAERSSRALNMVYSQIVFALIVDKVAWGTTPGPVSIIGGITVLGSVVGVAVTREGVTKSVAQQQEEEIPVAIAGDEEMQLMTKTGEDDLDDEEINDEEAKMPQRQQR